MCLGRGEEVFVLGLCNVRLRRQVVSGSGWNGISGSRYAFGPSALSGLSLSLRSMTEGVRRPQGKPWGYRERLGALTFFSKMM